MTISKKILTLTSNALERLSFVLSEKPEGTGLRIGVKTKGCSGLSYELKFDKEIGETDKVFEVNNVKIAVEKKSFLYLAGTILEFSGGLNGKGFVFNNPNASRTCGCGESFSL